MLPLVGLLIINKEDKDKIMHMHMPRNMHTVSYMHAHTGMYMHLHVARSEANMPA